MSWRSEMANVASANVVIPDAAQRRSGTQRHDARRNSWLLGPGYALRAFRDDKRAAVRANQSTSQEHGFWCT